jgi:hypothetical protein
MKISDRQGRAGAMDALIGMAASDSNSRRGALFDVALAPI